jgi:hypothetical protein
LDPQSQVAQDPRTAKGGRRIADSKELETRLAAVQAEYAQLGLIKAWTDAQSGPKLHQPGYRAARRSSVEASPARPAPTKTKGNK